MSMMDLKDIEACTRLYANVNHEVYKSVADGGSVLLYVPKMVVSYDPAFKEADNMVPIIKPGLTVDQFAVNLFNSIVWHLQHDLALLLRVPARSLSFPEWVREGEKKETWRAYLKKLIQMADEYAVRESA